MSKSHGDVTPEQMKRDAVAAKETAKSKAKEWTEEVKQAGSEAADKAKHRARSMADEQKEAAAGQVSGVANTLRHVADSLEDQEQPAVAGYARRAASGLDNVAGSLSKNGIDDLFGTVEDFARRQPAAFLGGAVFAGFALARFAKSSSDRRRGNHGSFDDRSDHFHEAPQPTGTVISSHDATHFDRGTL